MSNTTTAAAAVLPFVRNSFDWIEPVELRALLKNNLGLNARQVSVSSKHGTQYLKITIRDARVDVHAVKEFAKSLNTWEMDVTDYVTGQSIEVTTSDEVDDAHAAPFLDLAREIAQAATDMPERSVKALDDVLDGLLLNVERGEMWLSRGGARRPYRRGYELRESWAIRAIALDIFALSNH